MDENPHAKVIGENRVGNAVHALLRQSLKQYESRGRKRFPLSLPLIAQPLDDNKQVVGESIELLTRDISDTGIGVISTAIIQEKYLLLRIPAAGEEMVVVAEIQWREQLGTGSYHRLGAKFLLGEYATQPPQEPPPP